LELKKKRPFLRVGWLAELLILKSRKAKVNLPMIQRPMVSPDRTTTIRRGFKCGGFRDSGPAKLHKFFRTSNIHAGLNENLILAMTPCKCPVAIKTNL
jgi:hypothetical protein